MSNFVFKKNDRKTDYNFIKPPHDDLVLTRVKEQILSYVRQQKPNGSYFFLETAGGIHSPVMSGKIKYEQRLGANLVLTLNK
jgi:hypothetical protein